MMFLLDTLQLIHQYWHVRSVDDGYDVSERTILRMEKLRMFFSAKFPDCIFVAVFDNPDRILFRKNLYPDHKADRTRDAGLDEAEAATMAAIKRDQDWHAVVAPAMFEADDVMASMASQYKGRVLIHSSDRDCHSMLQQGRVSIVTKSNTPELNGPLEIEYFTSKDLAKKYPLGEDGGLSPALWSQYQVLIGGKDNVEGWRGVGPKTALKIIASGQELEEIDLEDETLKLNKAQRANYESFCKMLPVIRLVRTLYDQLEWPEGIPNEQLEPAF